MRKAGVRRQLLHWQLDAEGCALAELGLHLDGAFVLFDDFLGDGEAEAGAEL